MKPEDLKPQYLKSGDIIKIGKSNPLYPELYGVIVECPVLIPNAIPYSWSTKKARTGTGCICSFGEWKICSLDSCILVG